MGIDGAPGAKGNVVGVLPSDPLTVHILVYSHEPLPQRQLHGHLSAVIPSSFTKPPFLPRVLQENQDPQDSREIPGPRFELPFPIMWVVMASPGHRPPPAPPTPPPQLQHSPPLSHAFLYPLFFMSPGTPWPPGTHWHSWGEGE